MKKITAYLLGMCCIVILFAFQVNRRFVLFILGDSISLQYGSYIQKAWADSVEIQRKGSQENALKNLDVPVDANGGDSRMVLSYLQTRKEDAFFQPDLLLLNCGLHDVKRNPATGVIAVDSVEYRANLNAIFALLQAKKIPVVWVRITEVIDSIHAQKSKAFNRYIKDVNQYNNIADAVCKKYKVDEIDLFSFTKGLGSDRFADHVHYIPRVIQAQGMYIMDYLRQWRKQHYKG